MGLSDSIDKKLAADRAADSRRDQQRVLGVAELARIEAIFDQLSQEAAEYLNRAGVRIPFIAPAGHAPDSRVFTVSFSYNTRVSIVLQPDGSWNYCKSVYGLTGYTVQGEKGERTINALNVSQILTRERVSSLVLRKGRRGKGYVKKRLESPFADHVAKLAASG